MLSPTNYFCSWQQRCPARHSSAGEFYCLYAHRAVLQSSSDASLPPSPPKYFHYLRWWPCFIYVRHCSNEDDLPVRSFKGVNNAVISVPSSSPSMNNPLKIHLFPDKLPSLIHPLYLRFDSGNALRSAYIFNVLISTEPPDFFYSMHLIYFTGTLHLKYIFLPLTLSSPSQTVYKTTLSGRS